MTSHRNVQPHVRANEVACYRTERALMGFACLVLVMILVVRGMCLLLTFPDGVSLVANLFECDRH